MSWPAWPGTAPPMPTGAPVASALLAGPINAAPAVLPAAAGMQYSPEQWAQAQQQNWQQWATWQQQFQQWQQRYGAEYQSAMQGLSAGTQPPLPGVAAPTIAPPLPIDKPPLPLDDPPTTGVPTAPLPQAPTPVQAPSTAAYSSMPPNMAYGAYGATAPAADQAAKGAWPYGGGGSQKRPHPPDQGGDYGKKKPEQGSYQWHQQTQPPPQTQQQQQQPQWSTGAPPPSAQNFSQPPPAVGATAAAAPKANVEELSEAEKKFDKEFAAWEAQFNRWKEQNANHPDKTQYREYEKKWESWRNSLLERREQMRKKRIALAAKAQSMSQPPPNIAGVPPPQLQPQQPQSNNEPLKFKQPSSASSSFPSQGNSAGGFLSSSSTGGIPGLDLVKDDDNKDVPEDRNNDIIDLDKESEPPLKKTAEGPKPAQKGPDLDAISKGINNILGDQKLLSMLSLVSQNQQSSSAPGNLTNTIAAMPPYGTQPPMLADTRMANYNAPPPGYNEPPPGFNDRSNQSYEDRYGQEDYYRQREAVNNFDDQTRSSFTIGPGDQEAGYRNNRGAPAPPQKPSMGLPESDRFLIRNSFGNAKQDKFGGPPDREGPGNFPQRSQDRNFGDKFGNPDRFQNKEENFGRNRSSGSFSQYGGSGFDRHDSYNEYDDYENEDDYDKYHDMFKDDEGPHYDRRNEGGHFDRRDEGGHFDRRNEGGHFDRRDEAPRFDRRDEGMRYDRMEDPYEREEGGYNRGFNQQRGPPPQQEPPPPPQQPKIQPLMQLNFEPPEAVQEPEEEMFEPATVIDYDHKSKYTVDIEVTVEPFYTFDYRHKPLNRIPFPQRPKWLLESVKSIKEFDPLASISTLQKYDRAFYDRREIERGEDRYVRRFDRDGGGRYDRDLDRGPVRRDDREGPEFNRRRPTNDARRDDVRRDDFRRDEGRRDDFRRDAPNGPRREDSRRDGDTRREDGGRQDGNRREDRYGRRDEEKRNNRNDFEELSDEDMEWDRDEDRRGGDRKSPVGREAGQQSQGPNNAPPPRTVSKETMIEEILNPPGRFNRPARIVIIMRGPPGSGKTYLAKLIKDKEVENGGSAPRILSLDDYFMVEQEKEVIEDGKKQKVKEMVYEYEAEMEDSYRASFVKSFKKTITDGYFPFVIVDNINDKVKYFGEMWSFAKQNGFQVYICQMDLDPVLCAKRNVHNRSEKEIEDCISGWEPTPDHHPTLDASGLLQSTGIAEVEMEDEGIGENADDTAGAEDVARSKWDNFDSSYNTLAKLDGVNKPLRKSKTMEEFLQLEDEWEPVRPSKPGQKRVRWADLEEQRKQAKMRAIGFTIGTDWNRMMDPTDGSSALTQTKYIERVSRY